MPPNETVVFVKLNSLPVFVNPVPGIIEPAPETCSTVNSVVPNSTVPVCVKTKPLFALFVPSSINVKLPGVNSAG